MNRIAIFSVVTLAAAAILANAGCGNYSNEDIDYQTALPVRSDVVVKLPQAQTINDPAKYYVATRDVVKLFNGILDLFLGIIDQARAQPPSQRFEDMRVWGPFNDDKHSDWQIRLVIGRVPDAGVTGLGFRFEYRIEFHRRTDASGRWTLLLRGRFAPSGSARRGDGSFVVDTRPLRDAGFPGGFDDLAAVDMKYQTRDFPVTVAATITNLARPGEATPAAANYSYREQKDGSGEFTFVVHGGATIAVQAYEVQSRWLGSGAGRADVRVTEGLAVLLNAREVDCWGIDTRTTYSRRDFSPGTERTGDENTCAFAAP